MVSTPAEEPPANARVTLPPFVTGGAQFPAVWVRNCDRAARRPERGIDREAVRFDANAACNENELVIPYSYG